VFKPGKRGLKFDLTTIALLQIAALAFGLHALVESRPVWITFVKDRFELVRAHRPRDADRAQGRPSSALSWTVLSTPARSPKDPKEQLRMMDSAILGGKDILVSRVLRLLRVDRPRRTKAAPFADLRSTIPVGSTRSRRSAQVGQAGGHAGIPPMRAGKTDLTVIVDRARRSRLALAPLEPWEY
jgi:hypothetical protein